MIPDVGIMIGFYILTRCLSFIMRSGDRKEHKAVIVLAWITIIIAALGILDLVAKGIGDNAILPPWLYRLLDKILPMKGAAL